MNLSAKQERPDKEPDWRQMRESDLTKALKQREAEYLQAGKRTKLVVPGYARDSISADTPIPNCIIALLIDFFYVVRSAEPRAPGKVSMGSDNTFRTCPRCQVQGKRVGRRWTTEEFGVNGRLSYCLNCGYWAGYTYYVTTWSPK